MKSHRQGIHGYLLSLCAAMPLCGCVSVRHQPLPEKEYLANPTIEQFAGTFRVRDDAPLDHKIALVNRLIVQESVTIAVHDHTMRIDVPPSAGRPAQQLTIDLHDAPFQNGRLTHKPKRRRGVPILPGIAASSAGTHLRLDRDGNLVVSNFRWESGMTLFLFPFYESYRSVYVLQRI